MNRHEQDKILGAFKDVADFSIAIKDRISITPDRDLMEVMFANQLVIIAGIMALLNEIEPEEEEEKC